MSDSTHFIATFKVEKVVKHEPTRTNGRDIPEARTTHTVASVVVKADNLEKLRSKIMGHVQLVEE